jgi:tetratricopeptide (TPR) repeat protein
VKKTVTIAGLLLLTGAAYGQAPSNHTKCDLRVEVYYTNDGGPVAHARVQLVEGVSRSSLAINVTDSSGTTEFGGLEPGNYHVLVSGDAIQTTDSGAIEIEGGRSFLSQRVGVQSTRGNNAEANGRSAQGSVAAADLSVPGEAEKEFKRAGEEMRSEHWQNAVAHLKQAIAVYPRYSEAFNDLAVCYDRLGQHAEEKEALQKAVESNDHSIPALVNLARVEMADRDYPRAAELLNKAIAADPKDVQAMTLLARVEFQQGQYEEVIALARKVHGMAHEKFAIVHYTAASAFERQKQLPEAIAELQTYLDEEPANPKAEVVKKQMAVLRSRVH